MDNWIIYEHISPSGKVYIDITSQNVERRWTPELRASNQTIYNKEDS